VNVSNRTGGQGVTGHHAGATAKADGHTLTMMTAELNMLHWRGLTDLTWESFRPLMMLNRDSAALFVSVDAPWKTIRELEADIRRSAAGEMRALTCSGTAKGATWHLAFLGWLAESGLEPSSVKWVPTRGASPSMQELIAGGLDMACCSLPEAQTLLDAERVRCLGVMADERVRGFDDVPTFREQGIEYSLGGWRALGVPKDTPDAEYEKLRETLRKIVAGEEFLGFMKSRGFGVAIEEGEKLATSFRTMDAQMEKILTDEKFAVLLESDFGPFLYPGFIGCLAGFVLVILLVGSRRESTIVDPDVRVSWSRDSITRIAVTVGGAALWILLLPHLGFVLTSFLITASLLMLLGNSPKASVGIAVILVPIVYEMFTGELGVTFTSEPGALDWTPLRLLSRFLLGG